ncbi:DNA gyrase subunit A, partial [hydrothermal vent metagenome]
GVRGIRMKEAQKLISLIVVDDDASILTATEKGYGKRTATREYVCKGRGGQGVISIQTSERNGNVVGAVQVTEQDEFMMISDGGTLIRTSVEEVRVMGRNTQGVRLIRLSDKEKLVEIERIELLGDEDAEESAE